jgi:hypothetical protein
VEGHYPALLVSLPHHVRSSNDFPTLRIGADQDLELDRIDERYLKPATAERGPVVLLFGCNTAAAAIAYEDFVSRLRSRGAVIVVGTLTTVIGPQAAPLACRFVELLWHRTGPAAAFGDVMREARADLVRRGNPLALALAAYGDADWRLVPRERAGGT